MLAFILAVLRVPHSGAPRRRPTHVPLDAAAVRGSIVIRWDRVVAILGWILMCLAFIMLIIWLLDATYVAIIEREYGMPPCTDAIADAGSMCWGEPR